MGSFPVAGHIEPLGSFARFPKSPLSLLVAHAQFLFVQELENLRAVEVHPA